MQRVVKLTSKGQVTIPQEIRRALRIQKGDSVVFEIDAQGVRLLPVRPASVFAEYEGIWRDGEGQTVEAITANLRELRGHDV